MSHEFIAKNGLIIGSGITQAVNHISNNSALTYDSSSISTEDAVKKYIKYNLSLINAGTVTQPIVTNYGNGLLDISSCTVHLYDNPYNIGNPELYTIPALNGLQLIVGVYYYITVKYNGGNPIYEVITDNTLVNHSDRINVLQSTWENSGAHNETLVFTTGNYGVGLPNKIGHRLIHTQRFGYESGFGLTVSPTLSLTLMGGIVWYDGHEIFLPTTIDTNVTHYDFYFKSGGTWTSSEQTVLNVTQYNNGTNLSTISNNKYAVAWIYRSAVDEHITIIPGEGDYTLSDAQISQTPIAPVFIQKMYILIGKIITEKNATTITQYIPLLSQLAGVSSAVAWGSISGNISNQTDLILLLNNKQNLSSNLTSLSGLTYASTSFVKMTGANTFSLDTNTYTSTSRQIIANSGTGSINGGGDLSADRTLTLVGDSVSPGNNMLYSTNSSGVKGWYSSGDTINLSDYYKKTEVYNTGQTYTQTQVNNSFLSLSGGTLVGSLSGTTISASTYYGDGSNLSGLVTTAYQTLLKSYTKEETGFVSPELITVTYSQSARTVTLSGTITSLWQGTIIPHFTGSSWTSEPHPTGKTVNQFLYYNGSDFIWSDVAWTFDMVQICVAIYMGPVVGFRALRECHGLLQWQGHRNDHYNIGTYLLSGSLSTDVVLNSITTSDRRPGTDSMVLLDEDLPTSNPSILPGIYPWLYLSGSSTAPVAIVELGNTDIVRLSSTQPYYNQLTGGNYVQTLVPNNGYMSVYRLDLPVSSDSESQSVRSIWVQGQTVNIGGNAAANLVALNSQLDKNPASLVLLGFESPEYRIGWQYVVRYSSGNWTIAGEQQIAGNRDNPVSVQGTAGLNSVEHDTNFLGSGTATSPLELNTDIVITNSIRVPILSATTIYGDGSNISGVTLTNTFNSHTGDTSIHFTKSSINISDLGNSAHTHDWSNIINEPTTIVGYGITDAYTKTELYNTGETYTKIQVNDLLTGKTDLSLFNTHTGQTNPHGTSFINLVSTAHTHKISDITDYISGGTGSGDSNTILVNQNSHNLSLGNAIRANSSSTYIKAIANSSENSEVIGVVSEIVDINNFKFVSSGRLLTSIFSGVTNSTLFLSNTIPGLLTTTEPIDIGTISKPVATITKINEEIIVNIMRGFLVSESLQTSDVSGTISFDFGIEGDKVTQTINNSNITSVNIKTVLFINLETSGSTGTTFDDFSLNGLHFNIENIVNNTSFDIKASALNNASGIYTIKYIITY